MKQKVSIKDKRNQAASVKKEQFRELNKKIEAERPQVQVKQEPVQQKGESTSDTLNPVRKRTLSNVKKSTAKAAGLKSTFVLNDRELLMTAFGRGNEAIREKYIIGGTIETVSQKAAFNVSPLQDVSFRIDGRVKGGVADNPLHTNPESPAISIRDDLIHARSALEQRYFGKTFEDNVHIQIIYNILDIEKLLTFHINNIIYTLNNFLRQEGEDIYDLIGYITLFDSYDIFQSSEKDNAEGLRKLFKKLCGARQLGYINLEVMPPKNDSKDNKKCKSDPNTIKLTESEFFDALYALSYLRQMLAHGNTERLLYAETKYRKKHINVCALLDRLYAQRVNRLNSGFLKKAAKNLVLLFKAYDVKDTKTKTEYVRDYYDFTVRHTYKNLGFSIKLLREHITADIPEAFILRDQRYDTVRGKLYPIIDFAFFRYYKNKPDRINGLVEKLRASMNEIEKDAIYAAEAKLVWKDIGSVILKHILPNMSGNVIKSITDDPDVNLDMLKGALIPDNATVFSEVIYLLTMFINGKEINDLLTTLVHKFDNIASFIDVMKEQKLDIGFKDDYYLFAYQSKTVYEELRTINSFARMSKPAANAKECMYIEAFKVLGIKADEEELQRQVKYILDPGIKNTDPQKHGLRNFIANNVIESERFKYLIRYGNVNKLKGIAQNRAVVNFVLKDVPDAQIVRYYNSINGLNEDYLPGMRDELADRLTGFSFEDIQDVRQNDRLANQREQEEKRQKQALVRLWLTVLYLVLKNLVYINSRYFLAFHCVERDRLLLYPDKWTKQENRYAGYSVFARDFLAEYPQKQRVAQYLNQNIANSDEYTIRVFRNKTEHLDTVRNADMYLKEIRQFNSWFDLYHYITQRRIIDQFDYDSTHASKKNPGTMIAYREELNSKTLEYFDKVQKYRTCCKDFIKALCVPFAYNLPRYKNLCIAELFDMNNPGKKGDGKTEAMQAECE